LRIPLMYEGFLSPACPALHHLALPVVSGRAGENTGLLSYLLTYLQNTFFRVGDAGFEPATSSL